MMTDEKMIRRLMPPKHRPIEMVLDTDAYNEIDDQFAIAYAMLSPEISVQAFYAAPYLNDRSVSPEDGMVKSYEEIKHILSLLPEQKDLPAVFMGSRTFMGPERKPVESPACDDLITRALARPDDDPLYVVAIGCPVNVSSALLKCPEIAEKIVLVWLGGHSASLPDSTEFNLMQDVPSSQVLFDSGVPMVRIPCKHVTTHLLTTMQELDYFLSDAGGLGQYLCEIVDSYTAIHNELQTVRSKVVWDPVTIAYLVNPDWVSTVLVHSPHLHEDCRLSMDDARHFQREAVSINRDAIFADLFKKLGSKRLQRSET